MHRLSTTSRQVDVTKVRLLACVQVGQAFTDAADQYVRKFLNNGVPSLFSDLKPLYRYCCCAALRCCDHTLLKH